ncbi:hypothetical protein TNCV_1047241 [Trichonephila clavipes]|nr:hypothetical protein TNCV_1047241 [Trichonephila clavipes]
MVALSVAVNPLLLIKALKRHSQLLVRTASGYYLTAVVPFNISLTGIRFNLIGNDICSCGLDAEKTEHV